MVGGARDGAFWARGLEWCGARRSALYEWGQQQRILYFYTRFLKFLKLEEDACFTAPTGSEAGPVSSGWAS